MADSGFPHYLDITVSADDRGSVWQLIHELKPHWNQEDIQEKSFSHGLINTNTCYYQRADEDRSDAIVVRVCNTSYGDAEVREREFLIAQIAHAAGCFPRIYASFNNGFVYQYAAGRNTNYYDITKTEFIRKFARKLHAFHSQDLKKLSLRNLKGMPATYDPALVTIEERGLMSTIPYNRDPELDPEGLAKFKLYRKEFAKDYLTNEYKYFQGILDEISLPVSLCHLDLHPHNMLLDPATGDITFLDFEVAGYHYTCYDLCYFLSIRSRFERLGFVSHDEPVFTDEHCMMFLREYLCAKYETEGCDINSMPEEELELLATQHKIFDILNNLQGISSFLALGSDLKLTNLFDHLPDFKEKYLSGKKGLPVLRDRCKELILKLRKGDNGRGLSVNKSFWCHDNVLSHDNCWTKYLLTHEGNPPVELDSPH